MAGAFSDILANSPQGSYLKLTLSPSERGRVTHSSVGLWVSTIIVWVDLALQGQTGALRATKE